MDHVLDSIQEWLDVYLQSSYDDGNTTYEKLRKDEYNYENLKAIINAYNAIVPRAFNKEDAKRYRLTLKETYEIFLWEKECEGKTNN